MSKHMLTDAQLGQWMAVGCTYYTGILASLISSPDIDTFVALIDSAEMETVRLENYIFATELVRGRPGLVEQSLRALRLMRFWAEKESRWSSYTGRHYSSIPDEMRLLVNTQPNEKVLSSFVVEIGRAHV